MSLALRGGLMLLLFGTGAFSQQLITIDAEEMRDHRVGAPNLIHSSTKHRSFQDYMTLKVIVDTNGVVESAQAVAGPEEFYRQAETLEAKRKFKPFERNGTVVRATFSDYVSIVPQEEWAEQHVAFPPIADWNSLRLVLERTACFGPCPAYRVEVQGNGEVGFDGLSCLVTGHHRGMLTKQAVQELWSAFRRADFFSVKDQYRYPVTDNPTYTVSIEFDGKKKTVKDYVGLQAGMPEAVRDLETTIDQVAGTEKWVKGNGETGAALIAEKWDFRADTDENRALFANVVAHGSGDLIRIFTAHGAPALSMSLDGQSALVDAARKGDLDLVKLMLDKQARPTPAVLSCSLGAAAASGKIDLVKFMLDQGAQVNGEPCGRYDKATVLMRATVSGHTEVVEEVIKHGPDVEARNQNGYTALAYFLERTSGNTGTPQIVSLLLAAGANPNSRDNDGRTPIFYACSNGHTQAIPTLEAAGADVNAKDRNGETVLMSCFGNPAVKAVVDAGADLTVKNRYGRTAAEAARDMGANDKAELLESAMAAKAQAK